MTPACQAAVDPFVLLSNYVTVQIVYAANVLGLWHVLLATPDGALDIAEFTKTRGLCYSAVKAIAEYLVRGGFLEFGDSAQTSIRLAAPGRTFLENDCLGHFALLAGAYGQVLSSADDLATGRKTYGVDVCRDSKILAIASTQIGRSKVHSSYEVVLDRAARAPVTCVVDLGCGAGDFLVAIAQRTRARKVVGVDVLPEACDLARATLATIEASAEVICGNISGLENLLGSYARKADLVTALFVLHELIGKSPGVEQALLAIKRLLRPGGRLLLLEKATDILRTVRNPPYFSEFKLVHDLTGQELCEQRHWRDFLQGAGLDIQHERVLAPHTGSVLFECVLPV